MNPAPGCTATSVPLRWMGACVGGVGILRGMQGARRATTGEGQQRELLFKAAWHPIAA